MAAILEHWPMALRETLLAVGIGAFLLGLLVRMRGGNARGLGMSLAIVGVMLAVAAPVGAYYGIW